MEVVKYSGNYFVLKLESKFSKTNKEKLLNGKSPFLIVLKLSGIHQTWRPSSRSRKLAKPCHLKLRPAKKVEAAAKLT